MNGEQILQRCRGAEREIRTMEEQLAMYADAAGRVESAVAGSETMDSLRAQCDAIRAGIERRRVEYTVEVDAVSRMMAYLDPMACAILSRYYIRGQTVTEIARVMGYSTGYIRNVKSRGCREIRQLAADVIEGMLPAWYLEKRQR